MIMANLPVYWRDAYEMDDGPKGTTKVLQDVKITIDPGHIGGDWVEWDDRHFTIGFNTFEIREGDMTLRVAKILERDLSALGAVVHLTRSDNNPVTKVRPEDFVDEAQIRRRPQPPRQSVFYVTGGVFRTLLHEPCRSPRRGISRTAGV